MDSIELIEKYAILTVGIKKEPIPSDVHIQKELFLLSNVKPDIKQHFNFEKHYLGPFSRALNQIIDSSVFVSNAFNIENNAISLQKTGHLAFNQIIHDYDNQPKFNNLLFAMKLIRDIYDRLSGQEFLFLIYETYPEYTEYSDKSDYLLKNPEVRHRILNSLVAKGAITADRYRELKEESFDR